MLQTDMIVKQRTWVFRSQTGIFNQHSGYLGQWFQAISCSTGSQGALTKFNFLGFINIIH